MNTGALKGDVGGSAVVAGPAEARIENDPAQGLLTLRWAGGEVQRLRHADLRWACPCAWCRSARLRGQIRSIDPDVRVTAIQSMGYGLQFSFSDGHDRGIFPWSYLQGLAAS